MWWEPRNGIEAELFPFVRELERRFLETRQEEAVFGVGTFIFHGALRPLLLLNIDLDRTLALPGIPQSWLDLPPRLQDRFKDWRMPQTAFFLFVTRPQPLAAATPLHGVSGHVIHCPTTGKAATLGFPLKDQSGTISAFVTVGHFTTSGAAVDLLSPGASPKHIGNVVLHNDAYAATTPEYDYAIVRLVSGTSVGTLAGSGVWSVPNPLKLPHLCTFYGAKAGAVPNMGLIGALTA